MDTQRFTDALVEELRVARTRARATNKEIAAKSGLSESTVNRILLGHRTPDVIQLLALTEALATDIRTLIDAAWAASTTSNVTFVDRWGESMRSPSGATDAAITSINNELYGTSDEDIVKRLDETGEKYAAGDDPSLDEIHREDR